MPWEPLRQSLHSKPRVLAGPLLRKVTPDSVTVWLAMRVGATVVLTVHDDHDAEVMRGERRSVSIGKNLHIVAVQATVSPPFAHLVEGVVYTYDLAFNFDGNLSSNLAIATNSAPLAYAPFTRPSFALPPQDLNLLRLIQGSCRMPHAEGIDMMPHISQLIEQSASNAYARPHQLLLTGDQIYADDVTDILSLLLADAGDALLDWKEQYLSTVPLPGTPRDVLELHPELRESFLREAGFSSEDLQYHLIGLGEYLAMYLFVWSDVLWPSTLPTFEEIRDAFFGKISAMDEEILGGMVGLPKSRRDPIKTLTDRLQKFRAKLPDVRRLLANVPSYMIFDDHEVTDDWNMSPAFCNRVYDSQLGLRVIQNGLLAYVLCQHWGNVPEDFVAPGPMSPVTPPGASILALIDTPQPTASNAFQQKAADYDRISKDIRKLLAIHDADAVRQRADRAVFHDPDSLDYHFTVEGPSHQVIFTDTRTWRSFPRKADGPNLLTKNAQTDQYRRQIVDAPGTGERLLFVVLSTNAPPVQPIRAAARHAGITNFIKHYPDVYEAWELPSVAFDRLLVALTSKLPLDASGQHAGPIVVLSGDVHHSFATRILYRATKRYEDDAQPRGATAVIAQLVTSSYKKQTDSTVEFQRKGYYAAPHPWISDGMIRHTLTEGYVGWNFATGSRRKVGTSRAALLRWVDINVDKRRTVDVSQAERLFQGPHDSSAVDLTEAPHYRYRFDYLLPTAQSIQLPATPLPALPTGSSPEQRKNAARVLASAAKAFATYNAKNAPKVIGVNNFGEIRLDWGAPTSRKVHHTIHWFDPYTNLVTSTTYSVRLDINSPTDPEFPDIKARTEP